MYVEELDWGISSALEVINEISRRIYRTPDNNGLAKSDLTVEEVILLRRNLGDAEWPDFVSEDPLSFECYLADSIVYIALSCLSVTLVNYHRHWFDKMNPPALCQLSPRVSGLLLGQLSVKIPLPLPGWLKKIDQSLEANQWWKMLESVERYCDLHGSSGELIEWIVSFTNGWRQCLPNGIEQEAKSLKMMHKIVNSLSHYHERMVQSRDGSHLMFLMIKSGLRCEFFWVQTFQRYFHWLTSNSTLFELNDAYQFWCFKKTLSENSEYELIKPIVKHLKGVLDAYSGHEMKVSEKLIWTKGGESFVRTFLELIQSGAISYKGQGDIMPIVRFLHRFVAIEKGKGAGFLTIDSLKSYFKKQCAEVY